MKTRNKLLKKGMLVQRCKAEAIPGMARWGIGIVLDEWTSTIPYGSTKRNGKYWVSIYWTGTETLTRFWQDDQITNGVLTVVYQP